MGTCADTKQHALHAHVAWRAQGRHSVLLTWHADVRAQLLNKRLREEQAAAKAAMSASREAAQKRARSIKRNKATRDKRKG